MNKFLLSAGLMICSGSYAQSDWLTVIGDHTDATADTVEVKPKPLSASGDHRVMLVRVSRAQQRINWDGIPFRSYVSTVDFDCAKMDAQFQQVSYYMQPGWSGEVHKIIQYGKSNPRPMRFRGVTPNPMDRIIKAACSTSGTN